MANIYSIRRLSLAVVTALLNVTASHAYEFEVDGIYYNIEHAAKHLVYVTYSSSSYNSYEGDIIIPDSFSRNHNSSIYYKVKTIGTYAFKDCTSLTSVVIPNSVTSINESAFEDCSSLTSVVIPSSVIYIERSAFAGCTSLTSVELSNSLKSIARSAFNGCTSLESVVIPSSVTSIGKYAFQKCTSLTSVEIPSSVTSIGWEAFEYCTSLTSVEIPSSVTSIESRTFAGCSSLTSVEIPSSVTSIDIYAFSGCSSLTSVDIPSSVTSIGESAFEDCSSLTSVVIPSSVTTIGGHAFYGCTSVTDVYSLNVTPPTCYNMDSFDYSMYENATLHVPSEAVEDYKNAEVWCEFFHIVGLDSYTVTISISEEEEINVGDEITISASIGGLLEEYATTDITYAWYMNVDGGETERIDGATSDTFVYTPTEAGTYGFYCGVTLNDTTVYSDTTVVEVVAIGSDDSDTGISSIEAEADGTYHVYSIDGVRRMTTRDSAEIESLPEGIYIVNGKKVAIKR